MSTIERIADRWSSGRESVLGRLVEGCSTDLFTARELVVISLLFPAFVLAGTLGMNAVDRFLFGGSADIPTSWPISVFWIHAGWEGACVQVGYAAYPCPSAAMYAATLLLVVGTFLAATYHVAYRGGGFPVVVASGTLLILLTNLLQGYQGGYVIPISGGSIQYYHDAVEVTDGLAFVSNFERLQPELLMHSRTHPPGAVLTFYFLDAVFERHGLMSAGIAVVSSLVSAYYLWRLLGLEFSAELSRYLTYLFMLVPAVQIYYLASFDALISATTIGAIYYFVRERRRRTSVLLAAFLVGLCSFLTFTPLLFVSPLFVSYELLTKRSVTDSVAILSLVALLYVAVYVLTGYNYANSFLVASALENPDGFRLLHDTGNYVVTRIEGVVEILLFFTPFLVILLYRYLGSTSYAEILEDDFSLLAVLGVLMLLGMFGAGVFRTGETARAANFVYPFLLVLVGKQLSSRDVSRKGRFVLATVVFVQTVAMQLLGFYFW